MDEQTRALYRAMPAPSYIGGPNVEPPLTIIPPISVEQLFKTKPPTPTPEPTFEVPPRSFDFVEPIPVVITV